ALNLILNSVNKKSVVASPTSPIVEISSLVGINKVQTALGGDSGDLVVSFPYAEGEIDKVSYTLENNFLNIIVKAGEKGLSFNNEDVNYTRGSGSVDLLFVVGTPRLADLGNLITGDKLKNVQVVNIDNKAENQRFGDIVAVATTASSVSEQMADIILDLGFSINQDVAQNLLSGIMSATNNFQNPATTGLAFETAGLMMKYGAQRVRGTQPVAPEFVTRSQPVQAPVMSPQPQVNPVVNNPVQPQPTFQNNVQPVQPTNAQAPMDWLAPKVYKGSSNV
ncbi:MAG TPA: hypothetical protein VF810_02955, partial [Patescibacteria group bacterium]